MLDFPDALDTVALGINDAGELVGFYADVSGLHGLLATTIPEPSTLTLLGVGSLSLIYLICRRREKALTGGRVAPVFTPVTVRERSLVGDSSIS
jgi:PEP-CTERM motif